jgi:predicted AAA+ superfamily ATPase
LVTRLADAERLLEAMRLAPVVLLTGARQVGKSTLVRQVVEAPASNFFDMEDPRDQARLSEPELILPSLDGAIVIDEAQRRPDLFPVLRVLADRHRQPGKFVVLGSASPDLVGLSAETLAGRVTLQELAGFRLADVGATNADRLWVRGGMPRSYLLGTDKLSNRWRDDYIATFLERDLAQLGFRMPATTMRRFWTMLAHYHGQTWNGAELARALGVSEPTVRRYLDALTDALVVRQLRPWLANARKRQVRSPKIYIRDSGTLHRLLGIGDRDDLLGNPKVGASWEGFVIEQILMMDDVADPWFWGTHAGAELDLLVHIGGRRIGLGIKRTARPTLTPSIRSAMESLDLDHVIVVHAGEHRFPLSAEVEAVPVAQLLTDGFTVA